jgi:competence protein ComEA
MTPSGDPFDSNDASNYDEFGEVVRPVSVQGLARDSARSVRDPLVRPQMKPSPAQQLQAALFNAWDRLRTSASSGPSADGKPGQNPGRSRVVLVAGSVCVLTTMTALGFIVGTNRTGHRGTPLVAPIAAQPLATLPLVGGSLVGGSLVGGSISSAGSIAGLGGPPLSAQAGVSPGAVRPGAVPGANSGVAVPTGAAPATIAVHAAGAVAKPAVYNLPAGARVDDVIAAAGGLRADADTDAVNLAAHVGDGERVFVPRRGQPIPIVQTGGSGSQAWVDGAGGASGSASAAVGGSTASPTAQVLDLNAASIAELDTLPGVGPATAQKIVDFRVRVGRFKSVSQLLEVPGIGDAKLAALRSRVHV